MNCAMAKLRVPAFAALAALVGLVLAQGVRAGSPAPAAPGPEAAESTAPAPGNAPLPLRVQLPAPPKPPASREIFDGQPYELEQRDRIDPFTLGRPLKGPEPPAPPPTEYESKYQMALAKYREAEVLLSMEGDKDRFVKCAGICTVNLSALKASMSDIERTPALVMQFLDRYRALQEKFELLEATAKRLKLRQDIEAEFASLKISVDGIVWRPDSPAAVVNGTVVREGSKVLLGGANQSAQVYRIRQDAVVFVYKGLQVSVRLSRGGL